MITAIISDVHIGNNKNNPIFHDITLKYAEWLRENLREKGITNLIICGDIFHDRVSINLTSIECAYKFFDILEEFNISVITGNHDCFYLHNSTIHSLSLFKKWTNVTVYDTPTLVDDIFYAPWGTELEDMKPAKVLIGHLELNGYEMSKNKICKNGMNGADLMQKYKVCFTGHFHKPQVRKYDNKLLLYTGSCFQLNWGESGEERYFYVLDTDTNNIKKFKNTISPRFEYIRSEDDYDKIKNNFISIQVRESGEEELLASLETYKPIDIKTQLIEEHEEVKIKEDIQVFKLIDTNDLIKETVDSMENVTDEEKAAVIANLETFYKECQ